ncbi:MAG: magnesium/cobalt transporter CorA [Candidatus Woesearchaeota archaeon]
MLDIFCLQKGVKKIELKDLGKFRNTRLWIDATEITKDEADLLRAAFHLHPLTSEDLYKSHIRIKVEEFPTYIVCVFYGISSTVEEIEFDFVLGKNFIISNHNRTVPSFEVLKKDHQLLETLAKKGPDFVFHKLLDSEVSNFFPVLDSIDNEIEDIEVQITKKAQSKLLNRILRIKRMVNLVRKSALPQREKISFLAKNEYKFISSDAVPYFRDVYDLAIKVSDSIDNSREMVSNAFEVYMSAVSNELNSVMKVLSVIGTIALPLVVISGIFGTNFHNVPGLDHPYGFWIMITGMLVMCAIMITYFKKKGWF